MLGNVSLRKKLPFISFKNSKKTFNKTQESCLFKDATHPRNPAPLVANTQP
jgi:hypothetical protein